jgi:hypothetical protein
MVTVRSGMPPRKSAVTALIHSPLPVSFRSTAAMSTAVAGLRAGRWCPTVTVLLLNGCAITISSIRVEDHATRRGEPRQRLAHVVLVGPERFGERGEVRCSTVSAKEQWIVRRVPSAPVVVIA